MTEAAVADQASKKSEPLGARLRTRRLELSLTLKDVAEGAGLSVGFISQVERGLTAPSLSSLSAIARVLDTHLTRFLTSPSGASPSTHRDQRPVYTVDDNAMTYERISAAFPGSVLNSVIIHEPPGHRTEPIRHDGEEVFYILDGAITVYVDGDVTVLEAGDSIHFASTKRHSSWNHTTEPATILHVGTMDVFGEKPLSPKARGKPARETKRRREP